jgi:hypothetical protein
MKKLVVDCSKPMGKQESVVDMNQDEIEAAIAIANRQQDPVVKSTEEKLLELENTLKQKGII